MIGDLRLLRRGAALVVLWPILSLAQEATPVFEVAQIEAIKAAEGKLVKVRGMVESTGKSRGSGMNFLNFPGGEFTAVVFAKSLKNFPDGEPADLLEGKWVEISGKVNFYKEKPQIVVEGPGQIVELDPATKKPVAAAPAEKPDVAPEPPGPEPAAEPKPEPPKQGKVDPRLYFDDP